VTRSIPPHAGARSQPRRSKATGSATPAGRPDDLIAQWSLGDCGPDRGMWQEAPAVWDEVIVQKQPLFCPQEQVLAAERWKNPTGATSATTTHSAANRWMIKRRIRVSGISTHKV
jgi:hypothetical protein